MSAKDDVYRLIRYGKADYQGLKQLQVKHPILQVRKVDKATVQVRFRAKENWINAEDFAANYLAKAKKDMNDLQLRLSKLLRKEEVLEVIDGELTRLVRADIRTELLKDNVVLTKERVAEIYDEVERLRSKVKTLEEQVSSLKNESQGLKCKLEAANAQLKEVDQRQDAEKGKLVGALKQQFAQVLSEVYNEAGRQATMRRISLDTLEMILSHVKL